ncbi:hypothetical protein [Haloechinothrix alba]|nr:hypothetical protein [Haloechinothrix alba]
MNQHRSNQPRRGGQHRQPRHGSSEAGTRMWRAKPASLTDGAQSGKLPSAEQIDSPTKPKRQRVVLADSRQQKTGIRPRVELAQQTSWGEMLIKDLIGAQLKLGLAIGLVVLVLLGSLPVAFVVAPGFAEVTVAGIPLAWLLLGVVPFPLLFGAGLLYNRIAERHERAFVDMIEN